MKAAQREADSHGKQERDGHWVETPVLCACAAPEGATVMENFMIAGVHLQMLETRQAPSRTNAKEATPGHVTEKPQETRGEGQTLMATREK